MTGRAPVKIVRDQLVLGPVTVEFQRTLRIPETGLHPLPPGLGRFPLRRVADYPDTAPAEWLSRGGVMLPIYQREAMWLSFNASEPAALQVGVGKVCAVSGLPWIEHLIGDPQNYVALPDQPWLDGINAGDGFIRQFVAVPLGSGATVEGQVTGQETHGGVQLRAVGLTEQALAEWRAAQTLRTECCADLVLAAARCRRPRRAWGWGPAGGCARRCTPTIARSLTTTRAVPGGCSSTCARPRSGPPSPERCRLRRRSTGTPTCDAGLPWFDYYNADARDLAPSEILAQVKSVGKKLGAEENPFVPVDPETVIALGGVSPDAVTDGKW